MPHGARCAGAARDLERHDHHVSRLDGRDRVAYIHHLRDALVPEREGLADRNHSGQERRIEVAHRDRQWAHERLAVSPERRCRRLTPLDRPRPGDLELPHTSIMTIGAGVLAT